MRKISAFISTLACACAAVVSAANAVEPNVSFKYDGKDAVLQAVKTADSDTHDSWRFTTQDGKVAVDVDVIEYPDFPDFTRMTTRVSNLSMTESTGVVSDLRVFTQTVDLPSKDALVAVNSLRGSNCVAEDFQPVEKLVKPAETYVLATPSGRSSNEVSPYIETSVDPLNGALYCVGWTGAWRAAFANEDGKYRVELGMLNTNFSLRPNESLLQPSILVAERKNADRRSFKTTVHAFMVKHNSPRDAEGNVCGPIVALTAGGGNKTPEMMVKVLNYGLENNLPFDVYWVDAGWYGKPHEADPYPNCGEHWWRYVGDWRVNTTTHPTGDLLPITDAVHNANKKFLLWFEPERICQETPIAQIEPFKSFGGFTYYGNPDAYGWIKSVVFTMIAEHHVDIYRQDFNMDPAGNWAMIDEKDGANRVGVAEAKHIEGLYRFLDEMREAFPWIEQENCASGGRRIDIEMTNRAHSYCRSDYYIGQKPGDTCFNLGQDMTLNTTPYLPFQGGETNCVPNFDDYGFMSVASSGTVFTPTDLDGGIVRRDFTAEETAWFQKMLGWAARLKPYYMGDFYQLTEETCAVDDCWCAWSAYREDLGEGFAIAFRRAAAPDAEMTFTLPQIDKNAEYEVERFDGSKTTLSGAQLCDWNVKLDQPRSFELIVIKKK